MKKYKEVSVKAVNELVCDKCGLQVLKGDDEYNEFICIEHHCGYGSILEDGKLAHIDICQRCFVETLGDYLYLSDRINPEWTDFFEGEKVSGDFMHER